MEIKEFENERNEKIAEFQKSYNFLKTQYSSSLLAAIQEKDPAQQQQLISRVLQINSDLSEAIREIVSQITKGTDSISSTTLDKLTQNLIEYQKQYREIQNNKDRLQTIKIIYSNNKQKLKETEFMYNMYLAALIVLTLLVIYFVMRTNTVSDTVSSIVTQVGGLRRR